MTVNIYAGEPTYALIVNEAFDVSLGLTPFVLSRATAMTNTKVLLKYYEINKKKVKAKREYVFV